MVTFVRRLPFAVLGQQSSLPLFIRAELHSGAKSANTLRYNEGDNGVCRKPMLVYTQRNSYLLQE